MTNRLLMVLLIALTAADAFCGWRVISRSAERARIRKHYSDVNSIEHGLLSVDAWMSHVRRLVTHKIDSFSLTGRQRETVKREIEHALYAMIDELHQTKPQSLGGKLKKAAVGVVLDKKNVPSLAEKVLREAAEPDTRVKLKELANEKLDEYAAETRDNTSGNLPEYYALYHVKTRREFNRVTMERAARLQHETYLYVSFMLISLFLFLAAWTLVRHRPHQRPLFVISVVMALIVLLTGLASPMIEIDARLRRVDFVLLGEHLVFTDQILFFQSKSILQVVHVLLGTWQADSMLVGVLLLLFSVVLPISKLIATEIIVVGGAPMRRNRFLQTLAFKTGKWSMADVLVVAIFMAYLGAKAILDSQMEELTVRSQSLSSLATNQTSLQPGYVLFTGFVLFSLILSEILKRARR